MAYYTAPPERFDWQTPPEIFDPLHREFGFTIDAAATKENALLPRYWTKEDDALVQDWGGERVWCNPPYGKFQIPFIRKAAQRKAEIAVLLIPARTDTLIWHECIFGVAEVRFIKGRIRFDGKFRAPFPSALCIYQRVVRQFEKRFFRSV